MEGEETPFEGVSSPSKPPSSPRTSLHDNRRSDLQIFSVLKAAVAVQGSFWVAWEVRGGIECGFAPDWWGHVGSVYVFCKCRFIPPHQSLTRQLPPEGKPSLRRANMVNGCASIANKNANIANKNLRSW